MLPFVCVTESQRGNEAVAATAVINDYNNNDTASTNLNSSFLVDFRCYAGGCLPACVLLRIAALYTLESSRTRLHIHDTQCEQN